MRPLPSLAAIAAAALALGTAAPAAPAAARPRATTAAPAAPLSLWPQPELYALDLAYDADRFALAGSERITLRNSGRAPLRSVWIRTWGNAFGGCAQRYVRVEPTAGARVARERVGCTALELRLDAPLAPGARTTVALAVDVVAPRRPDRFGRYAGAAYFGNALPLLAVAAGDAAGPRLPPYTFGGESFFSLSARWRVRLRLPPGTRAALTGSSDGRRDDRRRARLHDRRRAAAAARAPRRQRDAEALERARDGARRRVRAAQRRPRADHLRPPLRPLRPRRARPRRGTAGGRARRRARDGVPRARADAGERARGRARGRRISGGTASSATTSTSSRGSTRASRCTRGCASPAAPPGARRRAGDRR